MQLHQRLVKLKVWQDQELSAGSAESVVVTVAVTVAATVEAVAAVSVAHPRR